MFGETPLGKLDRTTLRTWLANLASPEGSNLAPATIHADSKKLTEDQRIEILRGMMAEYAKIKTLLPISKHPLEFNTDGTWDQNKWKAAEKEMARPGAWAT